MVQDIIAQRRHAVPGRKPFRWHLTLAQRLAIRCRACKEVPTFTADDYCIRRLRGVRYACCGHDRKTGYVTLSCGYTFEFEGGKTGFSPTTRPRDVRTAIARLRAGLPIPRIMQWRTTKPQKPAHPGWNPL